MHKRDGDGGEKNGRSGGVGKRLVRLLRLADFKKQQQNVSSSSQFNKNRKSSRFEHVLVAGLPKKRGAAAPEPE